MFTGMSNGSVVKARVVKIKDQQITRYVGSLEFIIISLHLDIA